jgi:hypothetical protein
MFGLPQSQTALAGGDDDGGVFRIGHGVGFLKKFDLIKMKSIGNFVSSGDASMTSWPIDTLKRLLRLDPDPFTTDTLDRLPP